MALLKILEWPAVVLESRSSEVIEFDEEFKNLVQDMHETMKESGGIGLAANQIGAEKRVLTICIPWSENKYSDQEDKKEHWHDVRWTFVNPVYVKKSGKIRWQEGCLSFPEIFEFVDRSAEVWIKAQNEAGEFFEVHANGLFAVCLQHEIDHIDGVVFITRMSRLKCSLVKKRVAKRHRLKAEGADIDE